MTSKAETAIPSSGIVPYSIVTRREIVPMVEATVMQFLLPHIDARKQKQESPDEIKTSLFFLSLLAMENNASTIDKFFYPDSRKAHLKEYIRDAKKLGLVEEDGTVTPQIRAILAHSLSHSPDEEIKGVWEHTEKMHQQFAKITKQATTYHDEIEKNRKDYTPGGYTVCSEYLYILALDGHDREASCYIDYGKPDLLASLNKVATDAGLINEERDMHLHSRMALAAFIRELSPFHASRFDDMKKKHETMKQARGNLGNALVAEDNAQAYEICKSLKAAKLHFSEAELVSVFNTTPSTQSRTDIIKAMVEAGTPYSAATHTRLMETCETNEVLRLDYIFSIAERMKSAQRG